MALISVVVEISMMTKKKLLVIVIVMKYDVYYCKGFVPYPRRL